MDEPGAAELWQAAKAEYAQIIADAQISASIARKRASGAFDELTPPIIAYLVAPFDPVDCLTEN
ncbi:MAG: hypothetical protein KGM18_12410 [Sphingomonadales bacterium]|nr:hypothetical protein [Sphingomonadales bacterium]